MVISRLGLTTVKNYKRVLRSVRSVGVAHSAADVEDKMKDIKIERSAIHEDTGARACDIAWPGRYRISPNKRGPLYLKVRQWVGYYGVDGDSVILKIEDYEYGIPEGVPVGPAPKIEKDYDVEWWSDGREDEYPGEHWGTEELDQLIRYLTQIRGTMEGPSKDAE